jgi:hypothetical protein
MTSTFFPTLALSALVALSACSREEVEAKMDQAHAKASAALEDLEHVDLSALSPEAIQQKAGEVGDYLSDKLEEIDDQASAERVKANIQPYVDKLIQMKVAIGERMPDMDSLSDAVDDLKARFADNESVMSVIQPLIDKLKALFE